MIISCDFYLFGIFRINSDGTRPQWDIYPQDMTDKQWRKWYRKNWLRSWCRYIITVKLVKQA